MDRSEYRDQPDKEMLLDARRVLADHLQPTPLHRYPLLDALLGCHVVVKHENHQPIGAFKIRGGIYLLSRLSARERACGVVTASTGNHGQSIAWAARRFGVRAIVVVPEGANPAKVESIRALGAEVRFHGTDFDAARRHVEELGVREGLRYIHSANEPCLIAGVATYALEMLEEEPGLEAIFVPVGGGSGAAGCCLAARARSSPVHVIAAQSAAAPAAYLAWRDGRPATAPVRTFAEGVATGTSFELTRSILRRGLRDFVLVEEDEIRHAIILYLDMTRNLAEGAGAIPLAAALARREAIRDKRVGLVLSGGNLSREQLTEILGATGRRQEGPST